VGIPTTTVQRRPNYDPLNLRSHVLGDIFQANHTSSISSGDRRFPKEMPLGN